VQDLDGDLAFVLDVDGEVDRSHAAAAQFLLDVVAVTEMFLSLARMASDTVPG